MNKYNYDYNSERVIELLNIAKGPTRSAAAFAEQSGVSPSSFCKVLGGYYRATERFIKKVTSKEAEPKGGVTYDLLMDAAGLIEKNVDSIDCEAKKTTEIDEFFDFSSQQEISILKNSVTHAMLQKFRILKYEYLMLEKDKLYSPNETLKVVNDNGEMIEWWMYYMHKPTSGLNKNKIRYVGGRQNRLMSLTSFFSLPLDPCRKISVCYLNPLAFEEACNNYRVNSYKGNLSLILVDYKTGEVISEEIISTYCDNNDYAFHI